ncbi:MAG TPA: ABC transporter substrate-binding protein [Jiangellaceae bacterium]|nr:ABC transporter substrate-binding protein [Jiangellaceae bacterium]
MSKLKVLIGPLALVMMAAAACDSAEVVDDGEEGGDAAEEQDTPAPEADAETILIGSLHPLTGALANDGSAMDQAVQMAIDDINEAGGIESLGGAQLELISADSQGDPEVGQTETQRMIDDGAVAIIGAFQSAVAINVATLAERNQIPFVIDVAVDDAIITEDSQYTFRLQPNATAMGQLGARNLAAIAEASGETVERIAYLHEESGFGTSVQSSFTAEAEQLGMEVVETITYNAFEVSDLTTELSRVAAADADVLAVTGYFPDGVILAREAMAVQPEVKAVYGVAHGAFDLAQFPADVPDGSDFYFDSNYRYDATDSAVEEIRTAYEEETGNDMRTAAVFSYQAVLLIADALERAGSAEPQALRDAISESSLDPLLAYAGPIEFDETGENVNAAPIVMQVQDGNVVQVYPDEFAEAEPAFPAVPWEE